jgi:hypothetical protein
LSDLLDLWVAGLSRWKGTCVDSVGRGKWIDWLLELVVVKYPYKVPAVFHFAVARQPLV